MGYTKNIVLLVSEMFFGTLVVAEEFDKQNVETAIGVDLGTTNSCVAVYEVYEKQKTQRLNGEAANSQKTKSLNGKAANNQNTHHIQDILLIPVTPEGLGIETEGGVMTDVIPRGSIATGPIKKSQMFTTCHDHQTNMFIKNPDGATSICLYAALIKAYTHVKQIFTGHERLTKYCRELGMLQFSGIPPAPRGVPKIEVTFHVDHDGLLHVKAEDRATNNSKSITMDKWWIAKLDESTEWGRKMLEEISQYM